MMGALHIEITAFKTLGKRIFIPCISLISSHFLEKRNQFEKLKKLASRKNFFFSLGYSRIQYVKRPWRKQ